MTPPLFSTESDEMYKMTAEAQRRRELFVDFMHFASLRLCG